MISTNWLNAALHRVPRTSYDWWRPWVGAQQHGTGGPLAAAPAGGGMGSGGPLQAPPAPGGGMAAPSVGTGGPYMANPGGGSPSPSPVVASPAVGPSPAAGVAPPPTNAFNGAPPGWLPSGGGGNMISPEVLAATGHPIAPTTVTGFGIPLPTNPNLVKVSPYQLSLMR